MTDIRQTRTQLQALEGRPVSVAMTDGSHIDSAHVISAGRRGPQTIWLLIDGNDVFLPLADVASIWESAAEEGVAA